MIPIDNLDELKRIELNIMKKVHEFCEENNIRYVLALGTLLGAVRHNGFIPWDDDIDIYIPRDEYERFIATFPEWGRKNHLEICGLHTKDNLYPRDMIKVCDTRTVFKEENYRNQCNLGVFVDLWPLDKVPLRLSLYDKMWIKIIMVLKMLALSSDLAKGTNTYRNLSFLKRLFCTIFGCLNTEGIVIKQKHLSNKFNHLKNCNYIAFAEPGTRTHIYKKEDLFPRKLHPFEKTFLYIPNNYDAILSSYYGDYMTPPPPEKQIPHHIQDVYWK